jgi:hypothetical protein
MVDALEKVGISLARPKRLRGMPSAEMDCMQLFFKESPSDQCFASHIAL